MECMALIALFEWVFNSSRWPIISVSGVLNSCEMLVKKRNFDSLTCCNFSDMSRMVWFCSLNSAVCSSTFCFNHTFLFLICCTRSLKNNKTRKPVAAISNSLNHHVFQKGGAIFRISSFLLLENDGPAEASTSKTYYPGGTLV